jgi:flagellar basal body rod protein FlgG
MNVGLYSGAAGMRVGQEYQQLISENLSLQSVPGYRQTLPVFTTDVSVPGGGAQSGGSGNPSAVQMTRVIDFSQGPLQPSGSPYHVAIQGQAFFAVREADGTTSYTRNGSFSVSPQGQLLTSDGASVLGSGGSAITINSTQGGTPVIAADGTISIDGTAHGKLDLAHFDNPSASLQPGAYGRFVAANDGDAKSGPAKGDSVMQGSLEQSNGNPVEQMANMIQAVRLYEANQKSIQAVDDNTNQLITNLGAHPQG